mgnify:CR=1 FL=1
MESEEKHILDKLAGVASLFESYADQFGSVELVGFSKIQLSSFFVIVFSSLFLNCSLINFTLILILKANH